MRKAKDTAEALGCSARVAAPSRATPTLDGPLPLGAAVARADAPSSPESERRAERRGAGAGRPKARAPSSPPEAGRDPQRTKRLAAAVRPEEHLARAMAAATPRARGIWARRGLALRGPIDRTTKAMLLRQLYLAHYEERRFDRALAVAEQVVELDVLPDVAHQDAARALQGLGELDAAAGHLRLAARIGPGKRKAFHWWTLGSLYYVAGRHADAIAALTRAARWGTTDKPLYQGQLALAQRASGQPVADLGTLIERLREAPSGQGYGRFVLGQLAYLDDRSDEARRYLEAFVERSESGRAALAIALAGEIALARLTLRAIGKT